MRQPVLTIFYQFDPWRSTIGGIQTIVRSFIKYAPSELIVRFVGTSSDAAVPIGQWHQAELAGRTVLFMPLLHLLDDNIRQRIPTTLKYTAALLRRCLNSGGLNSGNLNSDFMHFHRLEPTLAAFPWRGHKTLFIHNDIHQQITSAHDQNTILWQRLPQVYFAVEHLLIRQFSQILSCNSESAKFYQQHYPSVAEKVSLIKNTVDTEVFYPLSPEAHTARRAELAQRLHLPPETRFVLFAGRLHPQKDPLLLLRSIAALQDATVHLLIAGEGELSELVRAEVQRLNLSRQVTLLGAVPQSQLADLHRACQVLVLTSVHEGLPLVVLEALACGTAVVTTRCGETPNLLSTDSGVVCDDRTPEAIAAAIQTVLSHPDFYSVAACVRAARPYSAETVITDIYRDMLQRWQPQPARPLLS